MNNINEKITINKKPSLNLNLKDLSILKSFCVPKDGLFKGAKLISITKLIENVSRN
jgi:hypothetical protein